MTTPKASITSISFCRFKALSRFSISLREVNILVGPNNCGKSTIIGALRALAVALRSARVRAPERVRMGDLDVRAYRIPADLIPISLENVHTDYSEEPSWIDFRLSNGNSLQLRFPSDGGCLLVPETAGRVIATAAQFKQAFPISVVAVPVLGPVEHREPLVEKATVQRGIETHRAPRHFRSYWYYNRSGWQEFAALVAETWPGMEVEGVGPDWLTSTLSLACADGKISRELYWAGFGFQVWCQLLTHILRGKEADLIVVDEPEIYLHPDLQRQLVAILRSVMADVVLATHSSEILGEAEPGEVLLVDKGKRSAERLRDIAALQGALDVLGSVHNVTLASIARHGRVLFVENESDFSLVRQLAARLGLMELGAGMGITAVATEGFGNWEKVQGTGWGLARAFGADLSLGCIFDRDFRSADENAAIEVELGKFVQFVRFLSRKEIENYLLLPEVLTRAVQRAVDERARRVQGRPIAVPDLTPALMEITDLLESDVFGKYIGQATKFRRSQGADPSEVAAALHSKLRTEWASLEGRLILCPGKRVLADLRELVQSKFGVSLTNARIVAAMNRTDFPSDLKQLLLDIEQFRARQGPRPPAANGSEAEVD